MTMLNRIHINSIPKLWYELIMKPERSAESSVLANYNISPVVLLMKIEFVYVCMTVARRCLALVRRKTSMDSSKHQKVLAGKRGLWHAVV